MDTKPSHLPEMLLGLSLLARARHATQNRTPLEKLRAMSAAQVRYWTAERKAEAALRAVLEAVIATRPTLFAGMQKLNAKKLRPQRKEKNAARDKTIRAASAEGKTPKQIAADVRLSESQVRKILNPKTKTRA
jgi:DNA-binding NarL/FixJ family response regulator